MSILQSILTERKMYIATDTVVAFSNNEGKTPYPGMVMGHHSKIDLYPHIKCCVVGLGSSLISSMHSNFVRMNFFDGVDDLYQKTLTEFIPSLQDRGAYVQGEDNSLCLISFFGVNEYEDILAAYHIHILRGDKLKAKRVDLDLDEGIANICSPTLSDEENHELAPKTIKSDADAVNYLFAICSRLVENSRNPEKYVFPVGGEFIMTTLSIEGGVFSCMTSNLAKLPNWDINEQKISMFRDTMNKADILREQVKHYDQMAQNLQ